MLKSLTITNILSIMRITYTRATKGDAEHEGKTENLPGLRQGDGCGCQGLPVLWVIDGIRVGHGQGESKKEAEQCAAHSVSCAMSDEACGDILDKIDRLYRPKGTGVS